MDIEEVKIHFLGVKQCGLHIINPIDMVQVTETLVGTVRYNQVHFMNIYNTEYLELGDINHIHWIIIYFLYGLCGCTMESCVYPFSF